MADPALRLPENVAGDFFVDSTCIDCDACRVFAPTVFSDERDQSFVFHQPETDEERLAAQKALITCPTSSIGSSHSARAAIDALPEHIDDDVYRCGYASESSFGAISYFLRDREILIDSPRFAGPLVKRLPNVRRMLLTHQDDIADHVKFHERFGCERVLHFDDARGRTFELMPRGLDPVDLGDDVLMIPTPGHTRGHAVFLYRGKFLFTGDHLAWSPRREHLYAFRDACWYSWSEQVRSMERLLDYSFEWVLPGHGRPIRLSRDEMHESLERCVRWMSKV
ncbi:MAG TPA: MBL fold metallo-hydrolase [Thermoanaerobaculia bacterium]|jgi:glyoxylase-like metal-dependent hydrolase (beta-lactamase superfamily II)/ferredoxin|nr:MBL fold metallo-hydrolase [Thermoanaerobaculia bacterium]